MVHPVFRPGRSARGRGATAQPQAGCVPRGTIPRSRGAKTIFPSARRLSAPGLAYPGIGSLRASW